MKKLSLVVLVLISCICLSTSAFAMGGFFEDPCKDIDPKDAIGWCADRSNNLVPDYEHNEGDVADDSGEAEESGESEESNESDECEDDGPDYSEAR